MSYSLNAPSNSTGITTGGNLSIGSPTTTFTISNGTGMVVNNTVTPPTLIQVSWSGITNVTATHVAAGLVSYVAIDNAGAVVQQLAAFTNAQQRQYILIGSLIHVNLTNLDAINQFGQTAISPVNQLTDLANGLGRFNTTGNVFSANGANLNINKSVGTVYSAGSNWAVSTSDPNTSTLAALTALSFQYRFQNGTNGATGIAINPNIYDLAGVSTAVPSNKFTIQRIYSFVSNNVKIQPGQNLYGSLAEAKAALQTEVFVTEPSIQNNGILRGFLIVREGTTSLQSATGAFFYEAGKFSGQIGVGGQSVSSLQNAYDNSTDPEILTDATRGAVTIRRGSAADTDNILECLNGVGATTFTLKGNGAVAASSAVTGSNLSGTNTGDQTSIVGITGTFAQFNTAVTDAELARTDAANTFTGIQTFSTPIATGSVATMTATVGGGVPTPPNNTTTFLRGDGIFAAPAGGSGDMILASAQTNSGIKTFLDTTMKLRNVANTFDGYFVNTNTADRIYTLQNRAGILADDTDLALKAPIASPTFTGTVTIPTPFTIGAVSMTATGTELNYVAGVTSAIQTQINGKQASGTYVTSITVASSNGFTGSSSGGATPAITLTTSITGVLKGNGTAISAATAGSDYAVGSLGLAGGQTVAGSTLTAENLTLRANAADLTTGAVIVSSSKEATSSIVGSVQLAGGLAVAKRIFALDMTVTNAITGSVTGSAGSVTGFTAGAGILTGPAVAGVAVTLGNVETITGVKTMSGLNAVLVSSSGLTVRNPANTFSYTITGDAIVANRILNLPLTIATDTLMTLGLAQTVTGVLTLTTPVIGVATGTSLAVTGLISSTSKTAGVGYATGAGTTGVQGTSRVTTLVANGMCGTFTMFSAAQAADALITFTFTNSAIAANDMVIIQHNSATNGGAWLASVVPGAGSCTVNVRNVSNASITSATPFRWMVLKGAVA